MNIIKKFLRLIFKFITFFMGYMVTIRVIRKLVHFPVPAFVGRFLDSDYRRKLQPPEQIIHGSGIQPGMKVLEIGCGSGAYTLHVARTVGEKGMVYALDIQPSMLTQLELKLSRSENQDVSNVKLYENSAYELPFANEIFDVVYLITVLQEIPDQKRALMEARRVLKPTGKLAITEFLPDPDYPLMSTTIKLGEICGFDIDEISGSLWTYTVRFKKSKHNPLEV